MPLSRKILGIDFGTTNTSVSLHDGGKCSVLPLEADGATSIPTVLYIPEDGSRKHYFGGEAVQRYSAGGMKGRLIRSIKSCLPDPYFEGTTIRGLGFCRLEAVIGMMLKEIRARACRLAGEDIDVAVMGRPAMFSEEAANDTLAETRLRTAAEIAGFREVRFQREPVAAAYYYEQSIARPEVALVADLGGGTSDFTLMRLRPGAQPGDDRRADVLGVAGVYVAGDRLDRELCWQKVTPAFGRDLKWSNGDGQWFPMPLQWMNIVSRWHLATTVRPQELNRFVDMMLRSADDTEAIRRLETLFRRNYAYALSRAVEQAKIALSDSDTAAIRFQRDNIDIDLSVQRGEFEEYTAEPVDLIMQSMDGLLARAGLAPAQVDSVFLTGGTCRLPVIRRRIAERFGEGKLRSGEDFISVSLGLALSVPGIFGAPAAN